MQWSSHSLPVKLLVVQDSNMKIQNSSAVHFTKVLFTSIYVKGLLPGKDRKAAIEEEDDLQEAMPLSRLLDSHAKLFVRNNEDRTSSAFCFMSSC